MIARDWLGVGGCPVPTAIGRFRIPQNMITYKDANGETRYWKTQGGAWNFANKLNEDLTDGMWTFENEYLKGFYLEFKKD